MTKIIFSFNGNRLNKNEIEEILNTGKQIQLDIELDDFAYMIARERVENQFNKIKSMLSKDNYPVSNFNIPDITAIVCTEKEYDTIFNSIYPIGDMDSVEYGKPFDFSKDVSSAFIKALDLNGTSWLIIICNERYSVEHNLIHELIHIFEYLLKIPFGQLERKYNFIHD